MGGIEPTTFLNFQKIFQKKKRPWEVSIRRHLYKFVLENFENVDGSIPLTAFFFFKLMKIIE
jgi:hypothetical protein